MSSKESKNERFSQVRAESIPTQNVMRDSFGWEVPVEAVPIPSEGKVYPQNSPMFGKSVVEIKAMTAKEEDILSSRALIQQGTVISHLIRSCLIDKSIDPDIMTLGDRNALMISIRITGYGTDYGVVLSCPKCGKQSEGHFDLAQLGIKRLSIDPVEPGRNEFRFNLPVTKKEVLFKFLTGKDEQDMNVESERRRKIFPDMQSDTLVTSRLSKQIVSIDGIDDKNKITTFVNNMPARDSRSLRMYMTKHEPGIDMTTKFSCPHCRKESEVGLPLGAGFFWPSE